VRSDFDRVDQALRKVTIKGKPAKLQFSANKPMFNGATGRPGLVLEQAARPRFLPGTVSHSCHSGRLRVAPSPTEAVGSRLLFLRSAREEPPGRFRDFADQSPLIRPHV